MDNTFSESLKEFAERHPEQRMRTSLLQIFIDFLRYQEQHSYNLLNDIEALFELLEIINRHSKNEHNS